MNPNKKIQLADAKIQAKWFARVREAHRTETAEDYVELIADLAEANQEARLSDIAERFGVANATASKILSRLKEEGYIANRRYRSIFLTDKGKLLAKKCRERHNIVVDFLISIGVPAPAAQYDAEGIEHHISSATLAIFKAHTKRENLIE